MHARVESTRPGSILWGSSSAVLCLVGLTAACLLLLRVTDVYLHPQFWAEDGGIFFQQQKTMGAAALVEPYAGYLHLVPRLTAIIASAFPSRYAPALYNCAALAFTVWSAVTIASARYRFAWLGGLLLVAVPHQWGEVLGTITNIQWLLAPALAVVVATPTPLRPVARANQVVFTVCAALSGPFSILAVPLCAARLWTERDRHSVVLAAIVVASAATQLTEAALTYERVAGVSAPFMAALTLLDRWFGTLASGHMARSFPAVKALAVMVAAYGLALAFLRERVHFSLLAFSALMMAATWLKYLHGYPDYFDRGWYADR